MPTNLNTTQRRKAEFQHNRTKLLADNPPCHWCGINIATEADHVTPTIDGGNNTLENLVPSCKPCNARRGQATKTQRQREHNGTQTLTQQGKETRDHPQRFLSETRKPPQVLNPIFYKGSPELAVTGRHLPRLETVPAIGSVSAVDEIGDFASKVLGFELMPWQRHVLAGMTSSDPVTGKWLARVAYCSVARQQGKTTGCIAPLVGWWLTTQARARGQKQTVISVAHKLDLATAMFNYLAPILAEKFGAKVSWSYGRMSLTMPCGSIWHVRAATPQAGHGYTPDLITVDELWSVSSEAVDDGLRPGQRTRTNPLMAMFSTAGTLESKAMLRWREQGLRAVDSGEQRGLYFAEYSPPPTLDPMTPEAWAYANPAMGITITEEVLEAESQAPNRAAFLRASVNLFTASSNGWLEPGVFELLTTTDPPPPGGVLAIESSTDENTFIGVRAVVVGNKVAVTVAIVADTLAELWRLVEAEIVLAPTLRLAIVPSLEIHLPPAMERRYVIVGYKELLRWTTVVRAIINEGRLQHNGQHLLSEHVERATLIKHQGAIALSSTRSPGPITAARAMVWAVALAGKPAAVGKPMIVAASR